MAPVPLRHFVSYGPARNTCNPVVPALILPVALLVTLLAALLAAPLRAEEPVRIVAIGDSLTAGYGLPQEDGFVAQLRRWLEAQDGPAVELVNMGVSGDTTAGGRARLDWALAEGADAVILALGANDALRGVAPAETRKNLDAMLSELGKRGLPVLLIGVEAPLNYGRDYKAAFDAIYPELAEKHGTLHASWGLRELANAPGMVQEDGLHPSASGVTRIVERLGPSVLDLIARVKE